MSRTFKDAPRWVRENRIRKQDRRRARVSHGCHTSNGADIACDADVPWTGSGESRWCACWSHQCRDHYCSCTLYSYDTHQKWYGPVRAQVRDLSRTLAVVASSGSDVSAIDVILPEAHRHAVLGGGWWNGD